jgi:SAM-dependent methyltransferase
LNEYGEDLAYVHDAGFSGLAQAAANRVVAELRARGIVEGLVVDVGCGSGVAARRLSLAGYDVLGLDPSPAMLELARRRAPKATFRRGSFVDAELPPECVAVTAVGEVLNYHVAAEAERDLEAFFARVHSALRPGGLLALDVAGPGRVPGGGPARTWAEGDDWAALVESTERPGQPELTRRIVTFRRRAGRWRRTETGHHQRLYAASHIVALLRQAGFRARILRGYNTDEPGAPGHRALIARS